MTRRERLMVLLVMGAGAALRFWGIQFGLPDDFARPDEEKLIGAALNILQGDPNPHFFLYPTLFIYVMSAAYAVLSGVERLAGATASRADFVAQSIADPSLLHLTARLLAAAAGVATIPDLYSAVRRVSSARAALIASGFLAVAFLPVPGRGIPGRHAVRVARLARIPDRVHDPEQDCVRDASRLDSRRGARGRCRTRLEPSSHLHAASRPGAAATVGRTHRRLLADRRPATDRRHRPVVPGRLLRGHGSKP